MSIFSSILAKIGFGDDKKEKSIASVMKVAATAVPATTAEVAPAVEAVVPVAMNSVDVVAKLEGLASESSQQLNWKTSIVDLLKLLGLDSSFGVRKELAVELGCPDDKMADSAQMNMWLHKTVLQKLADNGGNIPADLLS
ncbi:MAG: DUF3597 domain-containing protein [Gammaproteobacteria bacterium]|nr:DUF3597 domain-containing protein [Gammaproteobacteria bacterium]